MPERNIDVLHQQVGYVRIVSVMHNRTFIGGMDFSMVIKREQ